VKTKQLEWRLDVIVNAELLSHYMTHRGETCRSLALKAGCSHQLIGFYKKGTRKHCPSARAKKIAQILDAPEKIVFTPEPSRVTRDGRLKASA